MRDFIIVHVEKKCFGSIGIPSGKTPITSEIRATRPGPTRPDPATREHACQGIDFAAFVCDIFGVIIIPVRSILTFNQPSRGYFRCAVFCYVPG